MSQSTSNEFLVIATRIVNLVDEKDKAYGKAFDKCEEFLKLLFPNGIKVDQYNNMLLTIRIFDKLMRLANNPNAFGESPLADICGYSLLGLRKVEENVRTDSEDNHKSV